MEKSTLLDGRECDPQTSSSRDQQHRPRARLLGSKTQRSCAQRPHPRGLPQPMAEPGSPGRPPGPSDWAPRGLAEASIDCAQVSTSSLPSFTLSFTQNQICISSPSRFHLLPQVVPRIPLSHTYSCSGVCFSEDQGSPRAQSREGWDLWLEGVTLLLLIGAQKVGLG